MSKQHVFYQTALDVASVAIDSTTEIFIVTSRAGEQAVPSEQMALDLAADIVERGFSPYAVVLQLCKLVAHAPVAPSPGEDRPTKEAA